MAEEAYLMTVNGRVPAASISGVLAHEHVFTNFAGASQVRNPDSISSKALALVEPFIQSLKKSNVNLLVECTPEYIGRNAILLKKISERTGILILTNTGYYAAVDRKYLPDHVYSETTEQLAKRWQDEFRLGISGTGIRPGFIKLGVGTGALDSIESKLLQAAIIVSKRTGLTIAVHTGDYAAALSEYQLLTSAGHSSSKWIWVHAQNASQEQRITMAKKGAWISLDGVSSTRLQEYVEAIVSFKKHHLLHRLLVSHDDGWSVVKNGTYDALELFNNGNKTPFSTIFTELIPALRQQGFTDSELDQLFKKNPVSCFSLQATKSGQ